MHRLKPPRFLTKALAEDLASLWIIQSSIKNVDYVTKWYRTVVTFLEYTGLDFYPHVIRSAEDMLMLTGRGPDYLQALTEIVDPKEQLDDGEVALALVTATPAERLLALKQIGAIEGAIETDLSTGSTPFGPTSH